MFFGVERGLHYLDKMTFLSEKIFGIQGLLSTYYQFHTNEEFSLTFDIHFYDRMKNSEDGFLLLLSKEQFRREWMYPSEEFSKSNQFEKKLGAVH